MSLLAATVLCLFGLAATAWFWHSAPRDLEPASDAASARGHQGRCVAWLETADLPAPRPPTTWHGSPSTPADRVLAALLLRHGGGAGSAEEAHARLRAAYPTGVAGAFVRGHMAAAARGAARRHFHGPRGLFPLWYGLVYRIRRGSRGVRLETLYQALEETRS